VGHFNPFTGISSQVGAIAANASDKSCRISRATPSDDLDFDLEVKDQGHFEATYFFKWEPLFLITEMESTENFTSRWVTHDCGQNDL